VGLPSGGASVGVRKGEGEIERTFRREGVQEIACLRGG